MGFLKNIKNIKKEKGMALFIVLILLTVLMTILTEILFQSQVAARAGLAEQSLVDADNTAMAGLRLTTVILRLELLRRKALQDESGKLALLDLLQFPMGSDTFSDKLFLEKMNLSASRDKDFIAIFENIRGSFYVEYEDEHAKLNLNVASMAGQSGALYTALVHLFSGEKEKEFLEKFKIIPQKLAENIIDYIDMDDIPFLQEGSNENDTWTQAGFEIQPANSYLTSMEELRRIPGLHIDDIYNMFIPYFTLWPSMEKSEDQKCLNVNVAPMELLALMATPLGQPMQKDLMETFEKETLAGRNIPDKPKDITDFWKKLNPNLDKENIEKVPGDTLNHYRSLTRTNSEIFKIKIHAQVDNVRRTMQVIVRMDTKSNPSKIEILNQKFL